MTSLHQLTVVIALILVLYSEVVETYTLVHNYDYTNWYSSFIFEDLPDPTKGFVDYQSLNDSLSLGLTRIIGKQIYMTVDNTSIIPLSSTGRKSIWLESKNTFQHGLLIGDFEHMPGSDCGIWPSFWTFRNYNSPGVYGEIDILEGFNDITRNFISLHTSANCTFKSPPNKQTGESNNNNYDCNLSAAAGCSVHAPEGSYGASFNKLGGGVYALQWASRFIKIFFFPRGSIPADIIAGKPNPGKWGLPNANFDSRHGHCDVDESFQAQTIFFDSTFCGAAAGGKAWTNWTDCSVKTGYATCEEYVANNPHAYDDAYWLINSVKIYQRSEDM
ncbi:glycoside hydrolase family 16 protein [Leptodontidium sp. MPI-SDFR-AT-0119]|nr:glycoside hydrolase family 16 protein [Leptodontidium sp. MPI-SDFR-AT-0119]